MASDDEYRSLSISKQLKERIDEMKLEGETYTDLIRDSLEEDKRLREGLERIEPLEHEVQQLGVICRAQSRLLVRMADAQGLLKEQIPRNLAEYEAWGGDSPWEPPQEATVDVFAEEKSEKHPDIDGDADHAFGEPGQEVDRYKIAKEWTVGDTTCREVTFSSDPEEGVVLDDPLGEIEIGVMELENDDRDIESYYAEMEVDN